MIKSWAIYCSWSSVKYSWTCNIYIEYTILNKISSVCVTLLWLNRDISSNHKPKFINNSNLISEMCKAFYSCFLIQCYKCMISSQVNMTITWCDTITKDKRMVLSLCLTSAKQFIWHCQAYRSAVSVEIIRSLYFLWYIKFRWRPSSAA